LSNHAIETLFVLIFQQKQKHTMKKYDVIVIGAGSAGLVAATSAHRAGLKTALIEKNKIGGECTHSGCVPSKALLNAAKTYSSLDKYQELGLPKVKKQKVDFAKVMKQVHKIIDGIYEHETPDVFIDMGIDTIVNKSGAKFLDAHTISIGKKKLEAKYFIIATGSSPRLLPFEGMKDSAFLHNDNFWELKKQPKHLVFIGGGVISVELGSAMAKLGTKVSIVEYAPKILGPIDKEVTEYVEGVLKKDGIKIYTDTRIKKFTAKKGSANQTLHFKQGDKKKSIKADAFFQAVGRVPNIKGLNLKKAGVEFTEKGVTTNDFLETNVKHIYACGDCTTPFKFTHTASYQANIVIHNITQKKRKRNDLSILPWAVFTEPEIAHVGLTEEEAIEKYGKKNITTFKVDASIDRFITDRKTGGFIKVIFDKKNHVLGADAVGAHAGEWVQFITIVMKNKIPASKMADTIFAYPTYSEIIKKVFSRYMRSKEKK